MKSSFLSITILCSLLAIACSPQKSTDTQQAAPTTKAEATPSVEKVRTQLIITRNAFRGITIGDKIASHTEYVSKDMLKNGEGDFDIFSIKDFNNNTAGYIMPDMNDESLVGTITVETQMAATAEGIKVGMTWGQLQNAFPDIEVHGSEIEGMTYANFDGINYRLDGAYYDYNIDPAMIPAETKIVEILLMGEDK